MSGPATVCLSGKHGAVFTAVRALPVEHHDTVGLSRPAVPPQFFAPSQEPAPSQTECQLYDIGMADEDGPTPLSQWVGNDANIVLSGESSQVPSESSQTTVPVLQLTASVTGCPPWTVADLVLVPNDDFFANSSPNSREPFALTGPGVSADASWTIRDGASTPPLQVVPLPEARCGVGRNAVGQLTETMRPPDPSLLRPVPPILIVFDLDGTLLGTCLSDIQLSPTCCGTALEKHVAALQNCFVDAPFFAAFCEAAYRVGHRLAIASFSDGAADRAALGATAAETVLWLLNCVLPHERGYLCSTDDVVCQPRPHRELGKEFHLQELQRRLNSTCDRQGHPPRNSSGGDREGSNVATGKAETDADEKLFVAPAWLSTDILLVDDSKVNCHAASYAGYHAACCAETGFTREWFAKEAQFQALVGLASEHIPL